MQVRSSFHQKGDKTFDIISLYIIKEQKVSLVFAQKNYKPRAPTTPEEYFWTTGWRINLFILETFPINQQIFLFARIWQAHPSAKRTSAYVNYIKRSPQAQRSLFKTLDHCFHLLQTIAKPSFISTHFKKQVGLFGCFQRFEMIGLHGNLLVSNT